VFVFDPEAQTFRCIFASPGAAVLDNPDNIAVSPRGGIVLCEDGDNPVQSLHGLTPDGEIFRFAENHVVLAGERNGITGNFSGSEWAGATFEPKNGNWLFVNIQTPGITFAITGPWKKGAL
jgi:secreted PhoX family phosphatase